MQAGPDWQGLLFQQTAEFFSDESIAANTLFPRLFFLAVRTLQEFYYLERATGFEPATSSLGS